MRERERTSIQQSELVKELLAQILTVGRGGRQWKEKLTQELYNHGLYMALSFSRNH